MTDTPDRTRELLARAEGLLSRWAEWRPQDNRPDEAIWVAHEALANPTRKTASAARRAAFAAFAAADSTRISWASYAAYIAGDAAYDAYRYAAKAARVAETEGVAP